MKIVGLITEYNPYHNGHKFHMEEAKRITNSDFIIVIMSGNFVQRGTPAIMDKYIRTKIALEEGADIIMELPTCYATASAESFALGAVSILEGLGIVDSLCFGSECGNISQLKTVADILVNEPLSFKLHLSNLLKTGITYPAARSQALAKYFSNPDDLKTISLLKSPNNILGIEYIKALIKIKSNIKPYTITRQMANYHDINLGSTISSASAIRLSILENDSLDKIRSSVPKGTYHYLLGDFNKTFPILESDFSLLLQYKLLLESFDDLTSFQDVSYDFAKRIDKMKNSNLSYSQLALELKTKQITLTRVNRALLHILLNIKKSQLNTYNIHGYSQYARLLGFRKDASFLLRYIKEANQIPVITKVADATKYLSEVASSMLNQDIFASNIYNKVIYQKYGTVMPSEYTHGVIIH